MQLTRHDGPGIIASKTAANLLVRLVERTLEVKVFPEDRLTADLPDIERATLTHLEDDGVARIGTEVKEGLVLIGRVVADPSVEGGRDGSLRCPPGLTGTIDSITMEAGAKKSDPRVVKVVVLTQFPLRVGDVLEAAGKREVVTALTDDEDFELKWPNLDGAHAVTRLEPFAESALHARSIGPYSLVSDMPVSSKDQFGGQRVTGAQLFALLDRGASHTARELITVKADDAQGRVRAYESIVRGKPECTPGVPRRTRTLERLLLALGFDVDFSSQRPRITLLTTAALKDLAPAAVKKPETINYRTFRPEKDGLFCEDIFGVNDSPERAVKLGRIDFAVPMMNPLVRRPVAKLLGIDDEKKFERLLYSEETLDGSELDEDWASSGPPALKKAAEAKDPSAAKFFVEQWPVLPPALRPLVPLDGGRFATSDLNDLYRRVINRNNRTRRLIELNAPAIIIRNEVRMLQESLEALVFNGALGRVITGPDKRPLVSLCEFLSAERGSLRSVDKVVDFAGTARFVITGDERVRLPSSVAYEIFKPWLYERLERAGHITKIKEGKREVEQRTARAAEAMREHAPSAVLLLFASSGAIPAGVKGFELWDEHVIGVGPLLASRLGVLAGDTLVVHATIDPRAEREVLALEGTEPKPTERAGGWIARASRADEPSQVLLEAALAEEADAVSDRFTQLLLARM